MQLLPHSNKLCLEYAEFVIPEIISEPNYKYHKAEGNIKVHGRGGNGNKVLIEFEELPRKYRLLVELKYGDVYQYYARQPLLAMVKEDVAARQFYANHIVPALGDVLPTDRQLVYARQCDWLNMIRFVQEDKSALRNHLQISVEQFWDSVIVLYSNDKIAHELPRSKRRLLDRLEAYKKGGYKGLISKKYGNQNTRKVNTKIERLIISLYCQPHMPFMVDVCNDYNKFMSGEKHLVDIVTGEVFDPADYYVKGEPYQLSESIVKYYLDTPANRAIADKHRLSEKDFRQKHRPAVKRHAPNYSFSKISMDDFDIPFKTPDGERAVKSYLVFDVASGAIVGAAFSRTKTVEIIYECLRDMVRLCTRKGWGLPLEIEVEQHLNSGLKGGVDNADLLTKGEVFPWVRFCRGGNPDEKRAENFINRYKYDELKEVQGFQYRPHNRNEARRLNQDRDKTRYIFEEIVRIAKENIIEYNNDKHTDQNKYPGMSRMQVLEGTMNPEVVKYPLRTILPYVGEYTKTSLRRQRVRVQYEDYVLPDLLTFEGMKDVELDAYYITDADGSIPTVHLYHDGKYLCEAPRLDGYNEAQAERTEADNANAEKQWARQKQFDSYIKENKQGLDKVATTKVQVAAKIIDLTGQVDAPETPAKVQESSVKQGGYVQNDDEEEDDFYSAENVKSRARGGL